MPKQGENPLWNYFKISNEDVTKAVCILCRKNLSRGSKDPHKMTTKMTEWMKMNGKEESGFSTSLLCTATLVPPLFHLTAKYCAPVW